MHVSYIHLAQFNVVLCYFGNYPKTKKTGIQTSFTPHKNSPSAVFYKW